MLPSAEGRERSERGSYFHCQDFATTIDHTFHLQKEEKEAKEVRH